MNSTDATEDSQDGGEVDAAATAEIAKGLAVKTGAKPATPEAAKPAAAVEKPADGATGTAKPAESGVAPSALEAKLDALLKDNQELRKRVEGEESRESRRAAEDFRNDFIRDKCSEDFPQSMLRRMLPATTDVNQLHKAVKEVQGWVDEMISKAVGRGRLAYVNLGGSAGGSPPMALPEDFSKMSPAQAIAAGLSRRGH